MSLQHDFGVYMTVAGNRTLLQVSPEQREELERLAHYERSPPAMRFRRG